MATISTSSTITYGLTVASQNPLDITNTATIAVTSGAAVYGSTAADWTITNAGTLSSSDQYGIGVDLLSESVITNSGQIVADGSDSTGIFLADGGTIINTADGLISGGTYGIFSDAAYTVIDNAGTIEATYGHAGVYLTGNLTNTGSIIADAEFGVADLDGDVTNSGTIIGAGYGVSVNEGSLENAAGGVIEGFSIGVALENGDIVNAGTILNTYEGMGEAVYINGSLTNSGSIIGAGTYGVVGSFDGATITNAAGGLISGVDVGIYMDGGGTITNAGTISGGTDAIVFSGYGVNQLVLDSTSVLEGEVVGTSTIANNMLELAAGGTGTITLSQFENFGTIVEDAGANWTLGGATTTDGQAVTLAGTDDVLALTDSADFTDSISGFTTGDALDLLDLTYVEGATATLAGDVLTVVSGGVTETLTLLGLADGTEFTVANDGTSSNGVEIEEAACFVAGTRIATARGEIEVEALETGDLVLVGDTSRPVVWLGHRRAADARVVRFRPHALGPNMPHRDLCVSHDHAMFVDGALVPAFLLVNGVSVVEETWESVVFFHVELETHAVLSAEGAPAESYLDTGNRTKFSNCPLGYDPEQPGVGACAGLVVGGPRLETIRATLGA